MIEALDREAHIKKHVVGIVWTACVHIVQAWPARVAREALFVQVQSNFTQMNTT